MRWAARCTRRFLPHHIPSLLLHAPSNSRLPEHLPAQARPRLLHLSQNHYSAGPAPLSCASASSASSVAATLHYPALRRAAGSPRAVHSVLAQSPAHVLQAHPGGPSGPLQLAAQGARSSAVHPPRVSAVRRPAPASGLGQRGAHPPPS